MATCPCRMHLCPARGHGCPRHCSSCACTQHAGAVGPASAAPSGWAGGRSGHTVQWQRAGLCHPCNAVPCCAMLCHAVLCHAVPCHALLCHTGHPGSDLSSPQGCAMLCCAGCPSSTASSLLCCAVPCHAVPCRAMPCCSGCPSSTVSSLLAVPCHAMPCHSGCPGSAVPPLQGWTIQCRATLPHAPPCCAVPCCAVRTAQAWWCCAFQEALRAAGQHVCGCTWAVHVWLAHASPFQGWCLSCALSGHHTAQDPCQMCPLLHTTGSPAHLSATAALTTPQGTEAVQRLSQHQGHQGCHRCPTCSMSACPGDTSPPRVLGQNTSTESQETPPVGQDMSPHMRTGPGSPRQGHTTAGDGKRLWQKETAWMKICSLPSTGT